MSEKDEEKPFWLDIEQSVLKMGTTVTIFLPDETMRTMDRRTFRYTLSRFLNNIGDQAMEAYDKQQQRKQEHFAEHLRSLREGDQEEQQRSWEQLEEVLAEDGKKL